jgi:hypothetical protein
MIRALALLLLVVPAWAHQAPSGWEYPNECCAAHNDCAMIEARFVSITPQGYRVVLPLGAHPRPYAVDDLFVPADPRIRRSGDGDWHLCIRPNGQVLCLYVAPGST